MEQQKKAQKLIFLKSALTIICFLALNTLFANNYTVKRTDGIIPTGSEAAKLPDSLRKWNVHGIGQLNFNQTALSHWAEGGESSLAGSSFLDFYAGVQRKKLRFEHYLKLAYGLQYSEYDKFRKTDDKIDLGTSFGINAIKNWYYTTNATLKTQFSNGYKYPDDSTVVSTFFAPAYLTISAGMQYNLKEKFSVFISPASGKFTFVLDQELANKGAFGVEPAVYQDSTGIILTPGKKLKPEFGINVKVQLKTEIWKNVNLDTKLELYNNYLDLDKSNRWNVDVNWEMLLNLTINEYLSTNIRMHMIYDHNVMIKEYELIDGKKTAVGEAPHLQFKESFGIGLAWKFGKGD